MRFGGIAMARAAAIAAAFVMAPSLSVADDIPRVTYVVGPLEPGSEAWASASRTLQARLAAAELNPEFQDPEGYNLVVTVDRGDRDKTLELLLKPGRLTIHAGGKSVESCVGYKLKGKVCLEVIGDPSGFMIVGEKPLMYGEIVADAEPTFDNGFRSVAVELTRAARDEFADLTANSVGHKLSIVIDGHILTAPVVQTPIYGGSMMISGDFDTVMIATLLSTPALPKRLRLIEERAAPPREKRPSVRGRKK